MKNDMNTIASYVSSVGAVSSFFSHILQFATFFGYRMPIATSDCSMGSVTVEGRYAKYGEASCRFSLCLRPSLVFPRSLKVFFLGAMGAGVLVGLGIQVVKEEGALFVQTMVAVDSVGKNGNTVFRWVRLEEGIDLE